MQLRTALLTDVGRVRQNNEDAIEEDRERGLVVLADGMGGYQAGEVASRLAVSTILDAMRKGGDRRPRTAAAALRDAVEQANRVILDAAGNHPQYSGMGTTVVACLADGERFVIAWVGDSRLYRLRGGALMQLTRDHSLVQELVDHGHYTLEQAQQLMSKNIVTRALGVEAQVQVDVVETDGQKGDLLLLCSDGLSDMLDDASLRTILKRTADDPDTTARALIDQANARGGKDNISVILVHVRP
jgi:protein phosphatase